MRWTKSVLGRDRHQELVAAIRELKSQQIEILKAQTEILKVILAANQTLAKLVLQKSTEPDELTHAQRAALLGLPESLADLVDWDQMKGRR